MFPPAYRRSIRRQIEEQEKSGGPVEIVSGRPELTEEQAQTLIMRVLSNAGYDVLSTVHRYKRIRCEKCGALTWPRGGYGATKGLGDLIVTREDWPGNAYVMADVKSRKGRLSPEQKARFNRGKLFIWRSAEEALRDCEAAALRLAKLS